MREYLLASLSPLGHEAFVVLFLDAQNRLIAARECFRGTLCQTSVYPREIVKITGKLPRDNLFGNLVHLWLYDPALIRPDRGNRVAWVLVEGVDAPTDQSEAIWSLVWGLCKLLSPVPLLDTWQQAVLSRTGDEVVTLMGDTPYPPLGRIAAARVSLPDHFPETVSGMVKAGDLALEQFALAAWAFLNPEGSPAHRLVPNSLSLQWRKP